MKDYSVESLLAKELQDEENQMPTKGNTQDVIDEPIVEGLSYKKTKAFIA